MSVLRKRYISDAFPQRGPDDFLQTRLTVLDLPVSSLLVFAILIHFKSHVFTSFSPRDMHPYQRMFGRFRWRLVEIELVMNLKRGDSWRQKWRERTSWRTFHERETSVRVVNGEDRTNEGSETAELPFESRGLCRPRFPTTALELCVDERCLVSFILILIAFILSNATCRSNLESLYIRRL